MRKKTPNLRLWSKRQKRNRDFGEQFVAIDFKHVRSALVAVIIPYGHQIADTPEDRWRHVPGIKKELEFFAQRTEGAKGRPGYKYKESDLRWRHVLLDSEKNIFLCDLESLEEVGDIDSTDEVVFHLPYQDFERFL